MINQIKVHKNNNLTTNLNYRDEQKYFENIEKIKKYNRDNKSNIKKDGTDQRTDIYI
jgi:hypothetical protein